MLNVEQAFPGAKKSGAGLQARCPAHQDRTASLKIDRGGDGRILLKCFAGCTAEAIVEAVGATMRDLMPDRPGAGAAIITTYDYKRPDGTLAYQVVRREGKKFSQRRPDGAGGWIHNLKGITPIVYRLPELAGKKTVFIPEGEKDCDRLWSLGLPATTNSGGAGKFKDMHTAQLRDAGAQNVVILPDADAPGRAHAEAVAATCAKAGLAVKIVTLPTGNKDVSDYLDAGHSKADLVALITAANHYTATSATAAAVTACTLDDVHRVFQMWLGHEYDLDALDAVLATAAAERLDGDPLWLLVLSGSGNAKTETVQALDGAGAVITSMITSEGALLSGTSKKEASKDATGGLLPRIGNTGVLVIKDVTSILSMDRNTRAGLLAALREVHDGRWQRNVGTDGGRTLTWTGRIAVIGAVTTAWDRAHDVIAAMGDRFVILRMDSTTGRQVAGRRAMQNTGDEIRMRGELAATVGGVLASVDPAKAIRLTDSETERLLAVADVVTRCRTGVDYDYRGDVIDAHAPEMPTRFAKQLVQAVRGAVAVGMDRTKALSLALRCARDSMPPLRLAILLDVAANPGARTGDVRRRIDKPWSTVDRQLQALHMLGVLTVEERNDPKEKKAAWHYFVADHIDPAVLVPSPDLLPPIHRDTEKKEEREESGEGVAIPTHFSGDASRRAATPTGNPHAIEY